MVVVHIEAAVRATVAALTVDPQICCRGRRSFARERLAH
jgi:hypothetical protein